MRPDQVGALIFNGQRVEPALYHRDSVVGEDGHLMLRDGVSPVSGEPANGFMLLPPVSNLNDFIDFLDWDGEGEITVHDVANALASVLPADVEGIEHFIRDHLDLSQDGVISSTEWLEQILPYCEDRLVEMLAATPVPEAPHLGRGAPRKDLVAWFDHFDHDGSGSMGLPDIAFAVSKTLYQALGSELSIGMKETVASLFLAETQLDGRGRMSRQQFIDQIAPALLANMPAGSVEALDPCVLAREMHPCRNSFRPEDAKFVAASKDYTDTIGANNNVKLDEALMAISFADGKEILEPLRHCSKVIVDVFDRQLTPTTAEELGKATTAELTPLRYMCHDPVAGRVFPVQANPLATLGELRAAVASVMASFNEEEEAPRVLLYVGARMLDGEEFGDKKPLVKLPYLRQGAVLIVVRNTSLASALCPIL